MTWTNAFDGGECTVFAINADELAWSGVLTKGSQSTDFVKFGKTFNLSVSADGAMKLSCSDPDYASGWSVICQPSYETSGAQFRASGITVLGAYLDAGLAAFSNTDDGIALSFDGSGACTPDPVASVVDAPDRVVIYANPAV